MIYRPDGYIGRIAKHLPESNCKDVRIYPVAMAHIPPYNNLIEQSMRSIQAWCIKDT